MTIAPRRFATIEAGGTKINVGIGDAEGNVVEQAQFETRGPVETLDDVVAWIDDAGRRIGPVAAIGIATFGPVVTDRASARWGQIGLTPKLLWQGADMIAPFRRFGVPLALDTDVNGAALAEGRWGAAQGCARLCYVTVGTGIGGGVVIDGTMVSGLSHPEMGHMFVRRHPDDRFAGACTTHGDCLEGLASGHAITARWGKSLSMLGEGHQGHALIAYYLAQACVNIAATLAPEKIVLGGGVIATPGLLSAVQEQADRLANGYLTGFSGSDIVLARFFPISGLIGGLAIAELALRDHQR